jgi:hypothetical protein
MYVCVIACISKRKLAEDEEREIERRKSADKQRADGKAATEAEMEDTFGPLK